MPLQPTEIRINNVIQYNGELLTVHSYDFANLDWSKAEGIGLTGEILGKCGFEWYKPLGHWRLVKNELWFSITKMIFDEPKEEFLCFSYANLAWDEAQSMPPKIVKYLHQLQNLIYALTGEEIQVNL
jgi:hypothetical protein